MTEDDKRTSDVFTSWITVFVLIAVAVAGLHKYYEQVEAAKVDRSLTFVTLSLEPFLVHRARLANNLNTLNLGAKPTAEEYAQFIVDGFHTNTDLRNSFDAMVQHLEGMLHCVAIDACDEATVDAYFGEYGSSFVNNYAPYICLQRHRWNNPGAYDELEQKFYDAADLCQYIDVSALQ